TCALPIWLISLLFRRYIWPGDNQSFFSECRVMFLSLRSLRRMSVAASSKSQSIPFLTLGQPFLSVIVYSLQFHSIVLGRGDMLLACAAQLYSTVERGSSISQTLGSLLHLPPSCPEYR